MSERVNENRRGAENSAVESNGTTRSIGNHPVHAIMRRSVHTNLQRNPYNDIVILKSFVLVILPREQKFSYLMDILKNTDGKIVVFVNDNIFAEVLALVLESYNIQAGFIYEKHNSAQREEILARFSQDNFKVLIGTSSACHAIKNIYGVKKVVNYELPQSKHLYFHRHWLVKRAYEDGMMVSFFVDLRQLFDYFELNYWPFITQAEEQYYINILRNIAYPDGGGDADKAFGDDIRLHAAGNDQRDAFGDDDI